VFLNAGSTRCYHPCRVQGAYRKVVESASLSLPSADVERPMIGASSPILTERSLARTPEFLGKT
jgi:hypothetical protein